MLVDRRGPNSPSPEGGENQLAIIEINVEELIASPDSAARVIANVVRDTESFMTAGRDTLVMTSRKLITGGDELSSLKIGSKVAEALVNVLRKVEVRPRFVIAKVCLAHLFLPRPLI